MSSSIKSQIESANQESVKRMMESDPVWEATGIASKTIPNMKDHMLLHAGPPIEWARMSGPLRGAIIGAIIYEGWANSESEAEKLAGSGRITFEPNHLHSAVAPMAGIISPSMPVCIFRDQEFGTITYSNINEGLGKVLRYGAYSNDVISRLHWMRDVLYPTLDATIRMIKDSKGGIPVKPIIAKALTMGDECHNRFNASTSLLLREITPFLMNSGVSHNSMVETYNFINNNDFIALNLVMAAAKSMTLAAHNIEYSTIVTALTRNGTDAALWVSGLGNDWFMAPAHVPKGVWFPGYSEKDANPDIGDSAITETAGFGGFAMAASPGIVSFVGGSVAYAVENTQKMYEITQTKHSTFLIPFLDFQGTPTGIDIRKVVRTGITPTINTGIAHRNAGVGQIGAGIVAFPSEIFREALKAYAQKYGI